MIILSPEGKAQTSAGKIAGLPQFTDLRGKVVGWLDNSKPNADKLAERLGELLKERYGVANMITRRKLTAQQGAPKQYLDELASQADFVICGLGDWGSCTSWSVHDSLEIQKRGRFAITLITHAFDALAKSEKEAFGAPDHPVLVVRHPIGTVKIEDVNKKAEAAFDQLVKILLIPEAAARTKVA